MYEVMSLLQSASLMVFSFQISPLTKEEEGSYECHATNSKGEASAVGAIHLVESMDDIIVKKGNAVINNNQHS